MEQNSSEFLIEIEDVIEKLFSDLDELRKSSADRKPGRQPIDQIFRHAHSVKGLSAAIGLDSVHAIAHEFENLLDALRMGHVPVNDRVLHVCENAVEALSESLRLAAAGTAEPSRRTLFNELQAAATQQGVPSNAHTDALLESLPSDIWQSLSEAERQRLLVVVRGQSPLFVVTANFHIANFDEEFFRLREQLGEYGEVIATSPTVDANDPDRVDFRILYASPSADLPQRISATFTRIDRQASPEFSESQRRNVPSTPSVSALSNFVRTDLEKLDRLISDTYELFRSTTNALALAGTNKKKQPQLGAATEEIRNSFLRLQSELINLRMVSLAPILQRASRMGRTAARASQKQIEFEIIGKDLRVDKVVGDALADPLIHLVRNAVDHGIESANEREQAGKPGPARIQIEALNEGTQTHVRVSDDGRGIDPVVISQAAARLGLIEDNSRLDVERSLRLIFRPGFTTLASATDVSGRGVGLDVVETTVENVGGELRVSSRLGAGTTFEIRLPVTFGLLTVSVLVTNGQRYCIPTSQVTNIENVSPTKSAKRTSPTGIVELSELLGDSSRKSGRKMRKLVTVHASATNGSVAETFHLIVDDVESSQEVLVRSLGRHAGRWYGVSGAAELSDGSVALVVDLIRLHQAFAN